MPHLVSRWVGRLSDFVQSWLRLGPLDSPSDSTIGGLAMHWALGGGFSHQQVL